MDKGSNRLFDELGKFFSDATGAAQGLRKEADSFLRTQCEKMVGKLNLVRREEFDVIKDALFEAKAEHAKLIERIEMLEKQGKKAKKEVEKVLAAAAVSAKNDKNL